jgi:hypothetical protein
MASVCERTIPTEQPPFVSGINANFCGQRVSHGQHGHILCFLDWRCYSFFQVAPQLYSRGWVDTIPDPLLLILSGSAGNRTQTSGSVARNSDHSIYTKWNNNRLIWKAVDAHLSGFPQLWHLVPIDHLVQWLGYELHLCGVVVRVPGYRSRGPGSIAGATRFSDK